MGQIVKFRIKHVDLVNATSALDPASLKKTFRQKAGGSASLKGCYIFGMRAAKGITPHYVGQTKRGFYDECFTPATLLKVSNAIRQKSKGTLVLFLIIQEKVKRGPTNKKAIDDLERYLIEQASIKNPKLINKQGTKELDKWSIKGINEGAGKPDRETSQFKKMIGLGN